MATTNLTKTPATAGNRNQWTWSAWVKRSTTGSASSLFGVYYSSGAYQDNLYFQSSGKLDWFIWNNNAYAGRIITDRLFRDVSAWYHVVCVYDNTLATATDRMKLYVNGVRETSLSNVTNPVQNSTLSNVNTTNPFILGNDGNGNNHFDGSMSHVHFIDGTAYDASTFGETDTTTGIWKPKTAPTVTYGTNGFFLKFENSASFGTDSSPNANNFTVNGTMTQTIDTPSNVFATWNPLSAFTHPPTFSNGNLTAAIPTSGGAFRATLAVSKGKWYCETKLNTLNNCMIGVQPINSTYSTNIFNDTAGVGLYSTSGTIYRNTSNLGSIASMADGDIIGMAIDLDNNNIYFSKNGQYASGLSGSWNQAFGTAYAISLSSGNDYTVASSNGSSGTTSNISTNFGNGYFGTTPVSSAENPDDGIGIFEYEVPTGYRALCTKSINAQEYS
jgi:hypothetical protein